MFSARTHWNFAPNALTVVTAARRAAGDVLVDLTVTNPTAVGLDLGPMREVREALSDPSVLRYEPEPFGLPAAREAVRDYYSSRGHSVDPTNIVLTASTSEAYGWLFKLLCDPGDEVLVGHPSYPLFADLAKLEGVRLCPFQLDFDGSWRIDLDGLRAGIGPKTRALMIVHPNNPTGSFVTLDEQRALVELCALHGIALVVDEVFGDYALREDPHRAPSFVAVDAVLTFTLSGLSKVAAMPQMKLGWIAVNGPDARRRAALQRLEIIADCYLSVGAPVQHAARAMFAAAIEVQQAILTRVKHNLATLTDRVSRKSRVSVMPVEGGWSAVLRLPRTRTEDEWCIELVERDGVVVNPGYFFDFESEAYVVLSLLPQTDVFSAGIDRLVARVDGD